MKELTNSRDCICVVYDLRAMIAQEIGVSNVGKEKLWAVLLGM